MKAIALPHVIEDLVACVLEYVEDEEQPPTLWEVQERWKTKRSENLSTGAIHYWLDIAVAMGKLKRLNGTKRKFAPISWQGPRWPTKS